MSEKKRKGVEPYVPPASAKKIKTAETSTTLRQNKDDHLDPASTSAKLLELKGLLDLSEVQTEQDISSRLDRIANILLREVRLALKRKDATDVEFEILEAEFYLQIGDHHEDPFTHGSEEQRYSGCWYFHRAPRFSSDSHRSLTSTSQYRGGSRKGMDLTFGGPPLPKKAEGAESDAAAAASSSDTRLLLGGVLLRTVRQVDTGKVTSGPSLLVDQILKLSGASGIQELVQVHWKNDISAFNSTIDDGQTACLCVKATHPSVNTPSTLYFSPRIGLDLSHPGTTSPTLSPLHPRIRFLPKRYRFFVHPELLVANGRPQTFLGILHSLVSAGGGDLDAELKKPSLSNRIARLMGIKEPTSTKYLADYRAGRSAGVKGLENFIGPSGKGASSSPAAFLRMMGSLSCIPLSQ